MSMFRKASALLGGGDAGDAKKHHEDGESLTTVLETDEDRSTLTLLICDVTELMRKGLVDTFNPKEIGTEEDRLAALSLDDNELTNSEKPKDDEKSKETQKLLEKQQAEVAKLEKEVSVEKMVMLKTSALDFFDDWRDTVILRVGEVVNSSREKTGQQAEQAKPNPTHPEDQVSLEGIEGTEANEQVDEVTEALLKLYPPIETPLRKMAKEKRVLILHSVFLLLLSLEHYNAHSRTLLLCLTTSLGLSAIVLSEDEKKVAQGLLTAAEKMSAEEETKKRAEKNRTSRRIKMGVAGVAGAALIGITGGLAAPLLATGIGTVLGGIGLGATATAGYLGALAGSGVLVGGLFGAYGAKMTSKASKSPPLFINFHIPTT